MVIAKQMHKIFGIIWDRLSRFWTYCLNIILQLVLLRYFRLLGGQDSRLQQSRNSLLKMPVSYPAEQVQKCIAWARNHCAQNKINVKACTKMHCLGEKPLCPEQYTCEGMYKNHCLGEKPLCPEGCLARDAWHQVPGTRCPARDAWHHNTKGCRSLGYRFVHGVAVDNIA